MRRATGAAKTNLLLAAVRVSWCLLLLSGVRPVSAADSSSKQRAAPVADFFEPFEPGWTSRWHYATAKKYKGRFEVVKPAGFQDTAIKVGGSKHCGVGRQLLCCLLSEAAAAMPSVLGNRQPDTERVC